MKTLFLKGILFLVILLKKLQRIFINFHEWIFKRKELLKYKTCAGLLEGEVETLGEIKRLLTSGESVNLTWNEKGMILNAIEYVPFKEGIELPETKAQTRITWRELREKIKLHMKEDMVKEDDETKGADDG